MNRRVWLEWAGRLLGLICAAVVVVPGVQYIIAPLRRKSASGQEFKKLSLLEHLVPNVPTHVPVTGSLQDAWTHYDETKVGDTWIVRRTADDVPPEETQVDAYSMICPHLGCNIQPGTGNVPFFCPCHNAEFDIDGAPIRTGDRRHINPAPRGMDLLESRVVQDEASEQWWVEVKFQEFVIGASTKIPKT